MTVGELVVIEGQHVGSRFLFSKLGKERIWRSLDFGASKISEALDEVENIFFAVSRRLSGEISALPKTLASRVILFAEVIPVSAVIEKLDKLQ